MIKKVGAFSVISLEWIGTPSEPLPPPTTHSRSSSSSSSSSVAGDRAHAFTMGVQKKLKMLQCFTVLNSVLKVDIKSVFQNTALDLFSNHCLKHCFETVFKTGKWF